MFINSDDMDKLIDESIGLMRAFKDLLENKVFTKGYFAAQKECR